MPTWEDLLEDLTGPQKKKPAPMWAAPEVQGEKGTGIAGIIGKLAQIGGTVANFIPGGQVVGVPLTIGGSALAGADKGGLTGAVKGAAVSGATQAAGAGLGNVAEGLKSPVDAGSVSAYSSTGAPMTVPGVRPEAVEAFSSQGSPFTVPASKRTVGGS